HVGPGVLIEREPVLAVPVLLDGNDLLDLHGVIPSEDGEVGREDMGEIVDPRNRYSGGVNRTGSNRGRRGLWCCAWVVTLCARLPRHGKTAGRARDTTGQHRAAIHLPLLSTDRPSYRRRNTW